MEHRTGFGLIFLIPDFGYVARLETVNDPGLGRAFYSRPHIHKSDSQSICDRLQFSEGERDGAVRFDGFRVVDDRAAAADQGSRRKAGRRPAGGLNGRQTHVFKMLSGSGNASPLSQEVHARRRLSGVDGIGNPRLFRH